MKERFLDKIRRVFSNLVYKFKESQFVAHISFLWHWKNFFFLLRYPFYRQYQRWTGKFMGYKNTEYDCLEEGWKVAFGKQLSKDIKKAGKESRRRFGKHISWKNLITWDSIKEKWGTLRVYASTTDEIRRVLDKYEVMSMGYCIYCGQPARYMTHGYVEYTCKNCFINNLSPNIVDEDKERLLNECRLTKKQMPQRVSYTRSKSGKLIKHVLNYKKVYNIDFEELWNLKK